MRIPAGIALTSSLLAVSLDRPAPVAVAAIRQALPPPAVHPHSTEICMNSRISYHGGWSGSATDQMIGDILHAASRAPTTGGPCVLYVATPQNIYRYDPAGHALVLHQEGDERADATAAFEIGFAAANAIDAGIAMHLAQLESIALWTGTTGQLASCPRGTAASYANGHWNVDGEIQIVVSFGIRNVQGFTSTRVAVSSDGSLADPVTDGSVSLDDALAGLTSGSTFTGEELTPAQVSQLLWASYGCNDHRATWVSGTAGLVCASGLAEYYMTGHVYVVKSDGVYRYHPRLPPGTDMTTRDHRIEPVSAGDARSALRAAVSGLPAAPVHLVLCLDEFGDLPELEVGFVAAGAMTEASSLGLRGHATAGLSTSEQDAIRVATGIPYDEDPMALVSLGHPSVTGVNPGAGATDELRLWIVNPVGSVGRVTICYALPTDAPAVLSLYDALGHRVRDIAVTRSGSGLHTVVWDCRDDRGGPVASGVYFCRLASAGQTRSARVVVIR